MRLFLTSSATRPSFASRGLELCAGYSCGGFWRRIVAPSVVGATPSFPPAGGLPLLTGTSKGPTGTVREQRYCASLLIPRVKSVNSTRNWLNAENRCQGSAAGGAAGSPSKVSSSAFCFVFLSHVVSYDVWLPRCDSISLLLALRTKAHKR